MDGLGLGVKCSCLCPALLARRMRRLRWPQRGGGEAESCCKEARPGGARGGNTTGRAGQVGGVSVVHPRMWLCVSAHVCVCVSACACMCA